MPRRSALPLALLLTAAAACGEQRVKHVAPDESRPHVTWEIRQRATGRGEELVCGSTQPAHPCVVRASTGQRAAEVSVHVFLHAAAAETSYLGVIAMPFLDAGPRLRDREVSITVPRGSQPVASTVIGRVIPTPGAYTFAIALDATQPGLPAPVRITQQAAVTIQAAAAGNEAKP